MGRLAAATDQFDTAAQLYETVLEIANASGDRPTAAGALYQLGSVHVRRGDYPAAVAAFEQSRIDWQSLGNTTVADACSARLAAIRSQSGGKRQGS